MKQKKFLLLAVFLAASFAYIGCGNDFVHVKGGAFQMGSGYGEKDETPLHAVTVSSFYMSKYQVTQKEWLALMNNNPARFKGEKRPVENVSWYDAIDYCNRLSEKEGLTPAYTIDKNRKVSWNTEANGYRLPTEAEWEYAARGGNAPENHKYSGSDDADKVAWHSGNSEWTTHDVGTKKSNRLGLFDMSGNVHEWCWDWYGNYSNETQVDPAGPSSGNGRVLRGGYWSSSPENIRSTFRGSGYPSSRFYADRYKQIGGIYGFRVVCNDKGKTTPKKETEPQKEAEQEKEATPVTGPGPNDHVEVPNSVDYIASPAGENEEENPIGDGLSQEELRRQGLIQ